jgi:DNA repair protein RadC
MKNIYSIRDLPSTERPRERLLKLGTEALSIPELLSVVMGRGVSGHSVNSISEQLLIRFGNLKNLSNASVSELKTIKGVGIAKAAQLKAAFELGRRAESVPDNNTLIPISTPDDVIRAIKRNLQNKKKEHFLALYLDTRNRVLETETVSIGSLNSSIVHPREAFKGAIKLSAASIIFIHNHPSGNPEPSDEDIELTRRLVDAGKILGIDVLDHIIISDHDYISLKARNLL